MKICFKTLSGRVRDNMLKVRGVYTGKTNLSHSDLIRPGIYFQKKFAFKFLQIFIDIYWLKTIQFNFTHIERG
jgi:hypothetical protein